MIEVEQSNPDLVIACLSGNALPGELACLGGELATIDAGLRRVLFDWSKLDDWRLGADEPRVTEDWDRLSRSIHCAAIVHHPRWNRQAAWIGALLRRHNALVRSWRTGEAGPALAWLKSA